MSRKVAMLACMIMGYIIVAFNCQAAFNGETKETIVQERTITLEDYRNRLTAGWIGQMAGVGWGAPTEFAYAGVIIPEDKVPKWEEDMINVFGQDDMYVEMTFLQSLLDYGIDVSIKQAGIDFANSAYLLWVANRSGRDNLRNGIAPPNSGHPEYNQNADAIDYQIEADYSGLIAPGLPNTAVELGETFGRLMNYGDGLYGGQFVGAMYAEAFFERDPKKIVELGLQYIPAESQYAEAIRDVLKWHELYPDNWEKSWGLINEKYHKNPDYRRFTSSMGKGEQNIDAKLNGAYIVMGLLYGEGDPDRTIIISMRCGQDSDCNPSNAAGILFTAMGLDAVPRKFITELDEEKKFSFTEFTFPELLEACEELAIQFVEKEGGRIEKDSLGREVFVIPVQDPRPGTIEQSWAPGPVSDVSFTREELAQIKGSPIFKWSLVALLLLLLVIPAKNRKMSALYILIPFLILYLLLELAKTAIPPDLLGTVNIIAMLQFIVSILGVLLLLVPEKPVKWFSLIGTLFLVVVFVGLLGSFGSSEGRFVAATKITIIGSLLLGFVWMFSLIGTLALVRKKYSRGRFNLLYLVSLYLFQLLGIYLVILAMGRVNGPWADLGGNPVVILLGALGLTLLVYLISVPYLLLCRYANLYKKRFAVLVNASDND